LLYRVMAQWALSERDHQDGAFVNVWSRVRDYISRVLGGACVPHLVVHREPAVGLVSSILESNAIR
jgi:hypothetical protein